MKRIVWVELIFVLLLGAVLFFLLYQKKATDLPLMTLEKRIIETDSLSGMEKGNDLALKRATGLISGDYEEVLYYMPDNTMSVNEMILVRMKESSQEEIVIRAFQNRIDEQKKNFDGYGTNQTYLLEQARILVRGKTVALFIGEEKETWQSACDALWYGEESD